MVLRALWQAVLPLCAHASAYSRVLRHVRIHTERDAHACRKSVLIENVAFNVTVELVDQNGTALAALCVRAS
jgi:hypothetical protein